MNNILNKIRWQGFYRIEVESAAKYKTEFSGIKR